MRNLIFRMDNAGCGNYRINLPYNNLSNKYKNNSFIVSDKIYDIVFNGQLLESLDNIVFQRPFSETNKEVKLKSIRRI